MWNISLSDAPCEIPSYPKLKLNAMTHSDPDSDVEPCVWAIVESCVAIFCACLPTFPALIKSIRDSKRRGGDPKSLTSLTSDDGPSGYRSRAGHTPTESVRMGDWEETQQIEDGGATLQMKKDGAVSDEKGH